LIATILVGCGVYGVAYVTYIRNNPQVGEMDFILNAWNLSYILFTLSGYIACLISTKFLLLPKFNVYNISQKKTENVILFNNANNGL
jgi:hypothetical protein